MTSGEENVVKSLENEILEWITPYITESNLVSAKNLNTWGFRLNKKLFVTIVEKEHKHFGRYLQIMPYKYNKNTIPTRENICTIYRSTGEFYKYFQTFKDNYNSVRNRVEDLETIRTKQKYLRDVLIELKGELI